MSGNIDRRGYDVTVNSIKYRFRRGEGVTGLRTQMVRNQVELQEITGIQGQRLQSRSDVRPFMQTDWSGGSRWEKPLLGSDQDNVYTMSNGLDLWSRPGFIEPLNQFNTTDHSATIANQTPSQMIHIGSSGFIAGITQITNTPNRDLYAWDSATEAWVRQASYDTSSGSFTAYAMVYNPVDSYFYWVDSGDLYSFTNSAAGNTISLPSGGSNTIHNLFLLDGSVGFYDGNSVYLLSDPQGTPSWTEVADDGYGIDAIASGSNWTGKRCGLAIATSEGIYYAKNVVGNGTIAAWVYRIERDSTGTYIQTPIATLPNNLMALDLAWHLGSLVIATARNAAAFNEQDGFQPIEFYHITGGSMGTLGLTSERALTESTCKFLGSLGPLLYIGGHDRIWAYDGIRGGIHPIYEEDLAGDTAYGPWLWMSPAATSGEDGGSLVFVGHQTTGWFKDVQTVDLDTVTSFGDDTDTHSLESAYFDFGLPFENKTIVSVEVDTEECGSHEQWTVFIRADDADTWTQVAAHTDTIVKSYTTEITGKRFEYKLAYETTSAATAPAAFRALKISALSGDVSKAWVVEIDGTESANLENQVIDPEDIYDDLLTLADTMTPITFTRFKPNTDTEVSYTARVARVDLEEDAENEFYARVVLVDTYDGAPETEAAEQGT